MKAKLPLAIYAIGLTSLLNDAASEMIYPLLPVFLTTTLGVTAPMLGVIEGAADALSSLLKLVSGYLSDRAGRRKPLVVAGYLVASIVRPAVAFARSGLFVLGVRLVDRIGKGLRSSPRDALIADLAPAGLHGRAFGVHEAMDHAGAVVGPLLAYLLLSLGVATPSVFLWSALPALAACAVVILFVHERPKTGVKSTRAEAQPTLSPTTSASPLSRPFVGYLVAVTLFALGNSSDVFLLLRAHHAGLAPTAAPLLWAAHHVVKSVVSAWGGGFADRVGRRRALAVGWLVYALIYLGFAFATNGTTIVLLFLAYGLYFGLVGGAQKALVAEIVPAAARARGFGAYHFCVGISALPASVLFGMLYKWRGPEAAFLTGAGLALAAIAALPWSRERASPVTES